MRSPYKAVTSLLYVKTRFFVCDIVFSFYSVLACIYGLKGDSELNITMLGMFKIDFLQHTVSAVYSFLRNYHNHTLPREESKGLHTLRFLPARGCFTPARDYSQLNIKCLHLTF